MTGDRRGWNRTGRALAAVAIAAYAVVVLRTAWMSDDSYITLRTVDNFVNGFGLRWNVVERVQAFTHPAWLFLISAFYALTREAFYTVIVLSIGVSLGVVAVLAWGCRKDPWTFLLIVAGLSLSRAYVDYSTSGLENPLTHLLLALFLVALPAGSPDSRRILALATIAGLGVLTRSDTVLLFGPALVVALVRHRRWPGLWIATAGLAPVILWHAFALVYYGVPYPNTALAKLGTGIPASELYDAGLGYLANSLRSDPLTLTLTACGAAAGLLARRPTRVALSLGVLAYLAYVVSIGGDFMSGRFLSAPFFLSVALLGGFPCARSGSVTGATDRGSSPWRLAMATSAIVVLGLLAPEPTVLSGTEYGTRLADAVDSDGIADERRYYFSDSGLFNGRGSGSRPTSDSWRTGRELREGRVALTVEGAVGVLGYAAGPGVHIVDYHALGDPLLSRLPMVRRDPLYDQWRRFGPSRYGWRPGHYLRAIPAGYLETLATGSNALADPAIARLYDDVARLTRGPVLDVERLGIFLRVLVRGFPEVAHRPRSEFTPIPWDELVAAQPGNPEAWFQLGEASEKAGDTDTALEAYRRAIEIQPRHGRALVALGALLGQAGRREWGLRLIDQALSIHPESANAWGHRAVILSKDNRHREAIEALLQAATVDPRFAADMYTNVGVELLKLRELDGALTWLARAEDLDPRLARIQLVRGKVLVARGDRERAISAFERALALDPALEGAALDLASLYVETGDRAAALRMLEEFCRKNPDSEAARVALERNRSAP